MKKSLSLCIVILSTLLHVSASTYGLNSLNLDCEFREIESSSHSTVGVFAIDLLSKQTIRYRAHRRFPLCSTNKIMGVSAILKLSESQPAILQKIIKYQASDLVTWSPVTKKHVTSGMKVSSLAQAALAYSDNTAINLLMKLLGGPQSVTEFSRSIGDVKFNLLHFEPELNTVLLGNTSDTSTPYAMADSLQKLTLGKSLAKKQQKLLIHWLRSNTTGTNRIQKAIPAEWAVGDKTGTCQDYGVTNDIAVIWRPKSKPIVMAIYFINSNKNASSRDDVIALVTKQMLEKFAQHNKNMMEKYNG